MREFIIRRILYTLLTLFAVATILFFIFRMLPGDPTAQVISPALDEAVQVRLKQAFGLDKPLALRARHFFGERRRVREGLACWQRGDLAGFGARMNASCESSIHNYQTGSSELVALQGVLTATPGVIGARFSWRCRQ